MEPAIQIKSQSISHNQTPIESNQSVTQNNNSNEQTNSSLMNEPTTLQPSNQKPMNVQTSHQNDYETGENEQRITSINDVNPTTTNSDPKSKIMMIQSSNDTPSKDDKHSSSDSSPITINIRRRKDHQNNDDKENIIEDNNDQSSSSNNKNKDDKSAFFECNICFDIVEEPVLTMCGHLFCWPCIYRWVEENPTCPVCKAGVTAKNVIPIYGRNSNGECSKEDVRKKIPKRPQGQRQEVPPNYNQRNQHFHNPFSFDHGFRFHHGGGGFHVSTTVFPSLFGFHFQFPMNQDHNYEVDQTPDQVRNAMVSRIMLTIGLIIFMLLFLY